MTTNEIIEQYQKSPYLLLHKKMTRELGMELSCILCNLIEKYIYFRNKNKLIEGKYFYVINQQQCYDFNIGLDKLKRIKNDLKKKGYIRSKMKGLPIKEYYIINWQIIKPFLFENQEVNQEVKQAENTQPNKRKNNSLSSVKSASYINKPKYKKNKLKNKYTSYTLKRTKFAYKDTSIKKSIPSNLGNNNTCQKEKLSKAERIIKYWNNINCPNITRHNNPNAKIYQSTIQMLDNMLQGLPIICKKDGFPHAKLNDFAQMYNIPPEVIEKPWKPIEIKKKLKQLAGQQTQKTSLQALLWNGHPDPKKCFSQILYEQSIEQLPDEYYELADQFFETLAVEPTRKDQIQAARHFEKLSKERHLQNDQLKTECLDLFAWLKKHRHEKYTPTVYSVYDFAEKYDKIKGQKERESKPTVKNKNGLHTDWEPGKESKVWKPVYE